MVDTLNTITTLTYCGMEMCITEFDLCILYVLQKCLIFAPPWWTKISN